MILLEFPGWLLKLHKPGRHDPNLVEVSSLSASKVFQAQSRTSLTESTRRFCLLWPVPQPPGPLKATWLRPRSWLSPTSVQTRGGQMLSCSGTLCTNPQRRLSTQVSWLGLTLVVISLPLKLLQWKLNWTNAKCEHFTMEKKKRT